AIALPGRFARLIKIEHTVFALPFAYIGAFLAVDAVPSAHQLVWVTLAMVGARSLAMGLNRLIDAEIDARNPRTSGRELPSGQLSRVQVLVFCTGALALYLVAVFQLAHVVRWLWPIPLVGFVVYPYLKRWTWLRRWAAGSPSPGSFRGRRGRSAAPWLSGSRGSTCSIRCSTVRWTSSRGCTPLRRASGFAACSSARGSSTR